MSLKAPGLKNVIEWGTKVNDYTRPSRRPGKEYIEQKTHSLKSCGTKSKGVGEWN